MRHFFKKQSLRMITSVLAICMLLSVVMITTANIEWPQKILSFEKYDPVYSESVEQGTAKDKLTLPQTIRAITALPEDADTSSFLQSKPIDISTDGYTSYDYFSYGYVAPKNAEELYAADEKVIYTIYYAKQDKDGKATSEVGEVAYRVFGAIDGGENIWFTCDETGNITGVVQDVPVIWEDNGYDKNKAGEYTFTASITGYTSDSNPYALVIVNDTSNCTCGAKDNEAHAEDCALNAHDDHEDETGIKCTCKVQKDEFSNEHDQECSFYKEDCTCDVHKNEYSAKHDENCGWYEQPEQPENKCGCGAKEGESHKTDCPKYVEPAKDCHCAKDGGAIDADNFPWAHKVECPLWGPIECMCRDENQQFTHVHDAGNKDCPLFGKDTVEVLKADGSKTVVAAESTAEIEKDGGKVSGAVQAAKSQYVTAQTNPTKPEDDYDAYIEQRTPTSGNDAYSSNYTIQDVPGSWVDYVNTIFMNKGYNEFAWTKNEDCGLEGEQIGWKRSEEIANINASESVNAANTPTCIPAKNNNVWEVYSGEQLRYAMQYFSPGSRTTGETIRLMCNIDLNGLNYKWATIGRNYVDFSGSTTYYYSKGYNITIDGNGHTIYNLGCHNPSYSSARFFTASNVLIKIQNITFETMKMVASGEVGLLNNRYDSRNYPVELTNVGIQKSLIYGGDYVSPFGSMGIITGIESNAPYERQSSAKNCYVKGSFVYSRGDHMAGFIIGLSSSGLKKPSVIENSFSANNLLCGKGGHSSGFNPCQNVGGVNMKNCFTANEFYGSSTVSGFLGYSKGSVTNCFSTGKVEGYAGIAGFYIGSGNDGTGGAMNISQCYSTALVGLRGTPQMQGGLFSEVRFENTGSAATYTANRVTLNDSYSAGEVGNYNVNMLKPATVGGFQNTTANGVVNRNSSKNNYYDKQTSAMREWAAGNTKTVSYVTGVLTGTTEKSGTGLASGEFGDASDKGFRGFSNNDQWSFIPENYPQLKVFSEGTSDQWLSEEMAEYVKNCSMASTATIRLNTWDTGFEWDDYGVKKKDEISYNRPFEKEHKGFDLTYDTVREIITDAQVTQTSTWSHMIPGGAIVDLGDENYGNSMEVEDNALRVKMPGMDWFRISYGSGEQMGYRPIRLISYMDMDAGNDTSILSGTSYDHRKDVKLRMMDEIIDNRIVGIDDDKVWSTTKLGGYPYLESDPEKFSPKYWAVPTKNMETTFTASKDAWLYTEIWRLKQNQDGDWERDISVKVTGKGTGDNTTLTEQKWNGEQAMYPDSTSTSKYLISYYWILADGRYRSDEKTITINPGEYNADIIVKNDEDGSPNSEAMYLGAAADTGENTAYSYSTETVSALNASKIGFTTNSALAWKKASNTIQVVKTTLNMISPSGIVYGTKTVDGELKAGSSITIPIKYFYLTDELDSELGFAREITNAQELDVTYNVRRDDEGGLYLRFNKLANAPEGEIGDDSGISEGALAHINDTQFDIQLIHYVKEIPPPEVMDFSFIKTNEDGTKALEGVEFKLYTCKHQQHTEDCGGLTDPNNCNHAHSLLANNADDCCWDVSNPLHTVESAADGNVLFESLESGDYMLVETKTLPLYQLPQGQWLIQVDTESDITITAKGEMPPAFNTELKDGEEVLSLRNYPIITLPRSGGINKILFTIGGVAFTGLAIILIIVIRKKKQ